MRAPAVFSFLCFKYSKASSFAIWAAVSFFVFEQGFSQSHENSINGNTANGYYAKSEKQADYDEKKQLQLFTVNLLKDFGCKDFEEKAFEAILENLRQNSQPRLSARDRHKSMISSLRVYNETDRPSGSFEPAKKQFSNLLFELNHLTTAKLFSYYIDDSSGKALPMKASDIANILETEKVTSFETPKKKILDVLKKLNFLIDDNHLDVGCRNEENKNFLMLNHPLGIVSLNDFHKYKNRRKEVKNESTAASPKVDVVKPRVEEEIVSPSPLPPPAVVRPPQNPTPSNPTPPRPVQSQDTQKPQKSPEHTQVEEQTKPKAQKENNEDIVRKYLSLDKEELTPYMKRGWNKDYEDFIVALILDEHEDLLDYFHKFEKVCYDVSSYDTPQKQARFIAKFFKALAMVETQADPRIETLESFEQKYRPRSKAFPKVAGKPYRPHSSGLFQLDENDYFNYACREINYERDVLIGHPSTRQVKTPHHTHPEYLGDMRKSILNPFVNAACAVKILQKNIPSGVQSHNSYWSPLKLGRTYDSRRDRMQKALVKEIPSCKFPVKKN